MNEFKQKLAKITERLKSEVAGLRTGRATPALVEDLEVEYFGVKTPLKALASISSPEPRQIVIQPWDKAAVQPIEIAIQKSSLGLNPVTDQNTIRLTIPALTEETRREMVKILGRHVEDARIQVRRERDEALKKAKAEGASENEMFRKKNEIQKIVDEANKKIEEMAGAKEKEIMTV